MIAAKAKAKSVAFRVKEMLPFSALSPQQICYSL